MKIEIDIDEKYSDVEVDIKAPRLTQDIEKLISLMRMINMQIAVKKDDETHLLDIEKILHIEAETELYLHPAFLFPFQKKPSF